MDRQIVKVFAKIGLQKKERWHKGTFVCKNKENTTVEINGKKFIFPNNKVKKFIALPDEEITKMAERELPDLVATIGQAAKLFLPVDCQAIAVDGKEHSATMFNATISPSKTEIESIGQFMEKPCWEVGCMHIFPATRDEPEDQEVVPVGHEFGFIRAAELFIRTVWDNLQTDFWEDKIIDQLSPPEEF